MPWISFLAKLRNHNMGNIFFSENIQIPNYKAHFNEKNLTYIDSYSNSLVLDVFDIFSSISYTDFFTRRKESRFNILSCKIGVNNIELISKYISQIEKIAEYMTGEKWGIELYFEENKKQILLDLKLELREKSFNSLSLLSGGIDSFCGANKEVNENNTLFLNVVNNVSESHIAMKTFESLFRNSSNEVVRVFRKTTSTSMYTQRARSLLYISSSFIYADIFNIETVKLYENGIVSLNPNVTKTRRTTKSTHPKVIYEINTFLSNVGIRTKVVNPFNLTTKNQMMRKLPIHLLSELKSTKTCSRSLSNPHFKGKRNGICHCGICLSCIYRQISFMNLHSSDVDYFIPWNISSIDEMKSLLEKKEMYSMKYFDDADIKYFFNEKKSLVLYFEKLAANIRSGVIWNYIDIEKNYYNVSDYLKDLSEMFQTTLIEIEEYLVRQV